MILTLPALTMLTTMAYLLNMLRILLRRKLGHDTGCWKVRYPDKSSQLKFQHSSVYRTYGSYSTQPQVRDTAVYARSRTCHREGHHTQCHQPATRHTAVPRSAFSLALGLGW